MNISGAPKRKYTSLVLSLTLHSLLLLWIIYTSVTFHQAYNEENIQESKHKEPAQLSFGNLLPPLASPVQTSTLNTPTKPEPALQEATLQEQQLMQEPAEQLTELTQSDTLPTAQTEDSNEPSADSPHTQETTEPSESSLADAHSLTPAPALPTQQESSTPQRSRARRRRRKKSTVPPGLTAALFVRAFKEAAQAKTGNTSRFSSSNNAQAPAHVQQRLDEWKVFNYRQKIGRDLLRACRLSQGYLYVEHDIHETLLIHLIIAKDGSFTVDGPTPFTGIQVVDTYMASFFSKLDLPPIPQHLDTNTFVHPLSIRINLRKGGNYIELHPIDE